MTLKLFRGFTHKEQRVLQLLVAITIVSRLALAFRPEYRIYTRPFGDDAFYIFSVSSHIAQGQGISVDGVHQTNGIQPLVTFLYVPFFVIAGADKLLALRLCFLVAALFDALSVIMIAHLVRILAHSSPTSTESIAWLHPPIIAAGLWALLYSILVHTAGGLETGVYSFFLLASMFTFARLRLRQQVATISRWIGLGVILGLTVLARIDAVILVAIMLLFDLFEQPFGVVRRMGVATLVAFIVSLPWWLYNYVYFGSLMPQSGISESMDHLIALNIRQGAVVIGDILSVFVFLPNRDLPSWFDFVWPLAMLGLTAYFFRRLSISEFLRSHYNFRVLIPYGVFGFALVIYYVFFFSAPHFLLRYFQPLRIYWLIVFACATPRLIEWIREVMQRKRWLVLPLLYLFGTGVALFGVARYVNFFVLSESAEFYDFGKWALAHPNSVIGMEQSGTAGFMSPNVVNLDGKVDLGALRARMKSDIGAYVVERNLDYIADWESIAQPIVESAARHGVNYKRVDSVKRVVIFQHTR